MLKLLRIVGVLLLLSCSYVRADKIDEFVETVIQKRNLVGLSLAIIKDNQIVKAAGYGFIDKKTKAPVTTNTLFQAGSISKPVSTLGLLHLVDEKKISLDEDVNLKLKTWKVPENEFTKPKKSRFVAFSVTMPDSQFTVFPATMCWLHCPRWSRF